MEKTVSTNGSTNDVARRIGAIISNQSLADDLAESIEVGLDLDSVHLSNPLSVWAVFEHSLNAAIRDINQHPKGRLLKRLIKHGSLNPDDPETRTSSGEEVLSDTECEECINFIFSHMVNRFKGDLAELLAIQPCTEILRGHQNTCKLSSTACMYLGDTIGERRRSSPRECRAPEAWLGFAKGADGLIVEFNDSELSVLGVIEVKSMNRPIAIVKRQIQRHVERMAGGLKIGPEAWEPSAIKVGKYLSIMVIPASWKLSRDWHWVATGDSRAMVYDHTDQPPSQTLIMEQQPRFWIVRLSWSSEALEQAAYEMTFWYMAQIGKEVFSESGLPKEWEDMSVEEAGRNSIKMMLYYIMLRYITRRQGLRATKLYNVYSFGYPIGVDARDMLWPEDLVPTS
jgi:hypothetical protein